MLPHKAQPSQNASDRHPASREGTPIAQLSMRVGMLRRGTVGSRPLGKGSRSAAVLLFAGMRRRDVVMTWIEDVQFVSTLAFDAYLPSWIAFGIEQAV